MAHNMKTATTYQDYYREQLDQYGIALIEDLCDYPIESESYITSCMMIVFHKQGELHVRYDMQDKVFTKHKVVILLPNHMVSDYWATNDFRRTLLLVSPQLYNMLKYTLSFRNHLLYHSDPECELTQEQWDSIEPGIAILRTILQSCSPNRQQMIVHYLDILLEVLNSYNITNHGDQFADDINRSLFTRFYEILIEHYHDSREIGYYAHLLNLTPKYFAKLIKQSTGISASTWIDNYVIMQAKTQLQGHEQYTIQQIANQVGFNDQSSFSRYFKSHTGLTPKEFRVSLPG